jgi:CRISPR-associated protein Csn2
MKINVNYIENELIVEDNKILNIEIYNKKFFYRFIKDLNLIENGNTIEEIIAFNKQNEEITLTNKIEILSNFLDFDLYNKKYSSDFQKYIVKNSEEKNIDKIVKEYSKVYDSISNIVNLIDIPITIKNDFDFESIIKSFKFEVNFFDNLLNNLIDLLEVKLNLSKEKIYVFINLKSYLSNEDLLELYKYIFVKNINSIFIDTNKYDDLNDNVNKIIIDTDLDEFVI